MRALHLAPRESGGVAHAMAVGVPRARLSVCGRWRNRRESGPHVRAERNADLPDNPARSCEKSPTQTALVPHAMTQSEAAFSVANFEARNVSTIMAKLDALAITQLMLDLCSAPCKARRFAPPARARGLRALTMPARRSVLAIT